VSKSAKVVQVTTQSNQQVSFKNDEKKTNMQKSTVKSDPCQALDLSIQSKKKSEPKMESKKFNSAFCKREVTKDTLKEFPVNSMTSQPSSCKNAIKMTHKEAQPNNELMRQGHASFSRLNGLRSCHQQTTNSDTLPQNYHDVENRPQMVPLPNYPIGFPHSSIADQVFKASSPLPTPSLSPLSNHSATSLDEVSDWKISRHMINNQSAYSKLTLFCLYFC